MDLSQSDIDNLIKRRHPEYEGMVAHWDFLGLCYVGGRKWFTKDNLFKYHKEGAGEYRNRLKRAYRFNHSREVVDLVNKYLFRSDIKRSNSAHECLKRFWKSTTTDGQGIDEFQKGLSTKNSIFGCPWVVVDSTIRDADTQSDEEEQGGAYAYIVNPQDVLDMSWADDGSLNWVLIREWHRKDSDPLKGDSGMQARYRLWTKTESVLIEKSDEKYSVVSNPNHNLGEVPAFRADNLFSPETYVSPALIADIAYLDRACANYASNLDVIIQDQSFSQLAMPAQNVLPGEDAYEQTVKMGTKRVFLYDGEGGSEPKYLSPDPRQAQLIISATQQLINEIYHSVGLAGERTKQDNSKGIDNSSGVAKSKDFERVVSLLIAKASALQSAERKMARLVLKWHGQDVPDESPVDYSDSFDVRGVAEDISLAMQLSALEVPDSIMSQQLTQLIDKMFPHLSKDVIESIRRDADNWEPNKKERSEGFQSSTLTERLQEESSRQRDVAGVRQSETKG